MALNIPMQLAGAAIMKSRVVLAIAPASHQVPQCLKQCSSSLLPSNCKQQDGLVPTLASSNCRHVLTIPPSSTHPQPERISNRCQLPSQGLGQSQQQQQHQSSSPPHVRCSSSPRHLFLNTFCSGTDLPAANTSGLSRVSHYPSKQSIGVDQAPNRQYHSLGTSLLCCTPIPSSPSASPLSLKPSPSPSPSKHQTTSSHVHPLHHLTSPLPAFLQPFPSFTSSSLLSPLPLSPIPPLPSSPAPTPLLPSFSLLPSPSNQIPQGSSPTPLLPSPPSPTLQLSQFLTPLRASSPTPLSSLSNNTLWLSRLSRRGPWPPLAFSLPSSLPPPHLIHVRGYKSNKRSLRPLNTAVSRAAVAPHLPPPSNKEMEERTKYKRAPIIDTAIPPIPVVPKPEEITPVGVIQGEYRLDLQPAFAVVQLGGKQFKVTADDILFVDHIASVAVNQVVSLDQVLLLGTRQETCIGRPFVPNAHVLAAVEEHFLDGKVHVFRFKSRNRYKKYKAPRPHLTTLRVLAVVGPPGVEVGHQVDKLPIGFSAPGNWKQLSA